MPGRRGDVDLGEEPIDHVDAHEQKPALAQRGFDRSANLARGQFGVLRGAAAADQCDDIPSASTQLFGQEWPIHCRLDAELPIQLPTAQLPIAALSECRF